MYTALLHADHCNDGLNRRCEQNSPDIVGIDGEVPHALLFDAVLSRAFG